MIEAVPTLDITVLLNPRSVRIARLVPPIAAWAVLLIGLVVIIGWTCNVSTLLDIRRGWENMPPDVAVALSLTGVSILCQYPSGREKKLRILGKVIAFFILLLGLLTFIEYLRPWNLHIDGILFSQSDLLRNMPFHGRMAPLTCLNLFLVGFGLIFFDSKKQKGHPISHSVALIIAGLSLLPLIGYLYGTPFHIGMGRYSDMAMHTSVCFLLTAFALFFSGINHDLATVLLSDGPGGFAARRLIFPAILILVLLGWTRVVAEKHNLFSSSFGTATFTTAAITLLVWLIWRQSATLQKTELLHREADEQRNRLQIEGELRDQFISMLSHDLRTPLTSASVLAQLIIKKVNTVEECKSSSKSLLSSLNRLDRMILDLLDSSRVRAGHPVSIDKKNCDIAEIVSSSINELSLIHGDRFITKTESKLFVHCDGEAIRRVIENLCNNAIKYGTPGEKITVTVSSVEKGIRLQVHNEGEPISPENQVKLFEPFQRAQKHLGTGGWGLGLTLVRSLIEAHHGKVWVESKQALGTTFIAEIPQ